MNGTHQPHLDPRQVACRFGVTQQMLIDVIELTRYARRLRELRELITTMLDGGEMIEPGRFTATVEVTERGPRTVAKLTAAVGEQYVRAFMRESGQVECRRVVVGEAH